MNNEDPKDRVAQVTKKKRNVVPFRKGREIGKRVREDTVHDVAGYGGMESARRGGEWTRRQFFEVWGLGVSEAIIALKNEVAMLRQERAAMRRDGFGRPIVSETRWPDDGKRAA